jgi:hypothetical protein
VDLLPLQSLILTDNTHAPTLQRYFGQIRVRRPKWRRERRDGAVVRLQCFNADLLLYVCLMHLRQLPSQLLYRASRDGWEGCCGRVLWQVTVPP